MQIELSDARNAGSRSRDLEWSQGTPPIFAVGSISDRREVTDNVAAFTFGQRRGLNAFDFPFDGGAFAGVIFVANRPFAFYYGNLNPEDTVRAVILSTRRVEVLVRHKGRPPPDCFARCADGTQGSPCVTCRSNGGVTRICC